MNKVTRATFGILVLVLVLCSTTLLRGEVLPEVAKLVPPETVLLVNIDDFESVSKQCEETNLYKLYTDPSMKAFVNDLKSKIRSKMGKANDAVVEDILEAKLLPEGRVTLALVLDEKAKAEGDPSVLVMAQWGDASGKIKQATDEMVKKAVQNGWYRQYEEYRGATIISITKESEPKQVPDYSNYVPGSGSEPPMKTVQVPPKEIYYCFLKDNLVGSSNMDVLKFAVAHLKGATSATLASDSGYATTLKAVGPYHDIDVYVNMKRIVEALISKDPTGRTKMIMSGLGLDNVAGLGFAGAVSRVSGISFSGKGLLRIDGAKKGIFKVLEFEPSAMKAPKFIPASAYGLASVNLNVRKAFEEIVKIASGFAPQAAAIMYMPLVPPGPNGEQGVSLMNDVINHLGSGIVIAPSVSRPLKADSKPEAYFAIATSNRQALERSLSLVHGSLLAPGKAEMRKELLGQTIYLVDAPNFGPFMAPRGNRPMQNGPSAGGSQTPRIAFAVTDNYLVLGTESTVEQAVRSLNSKDVEIKSVSSTQWFGKAKASIPSAVGWASAEDNSVSAELSWQEIRKSGSDNKGDLSMSAGVGMSSNLGLRAVSGAGGELVDFSLLPEFDSVRKYFGISTAYGLSRPDGIFFEFKYLNSSTDK